MLVIEMSLAVPPEDVLSLKKDMNLSCAHHAAVNLWTSMIVLSDLKVILHQLRQRKNVLPRDMAADYQDFVAWQRHYLQSSASHADLAFWRQELSGQLPQLTQSTDFSRPFASEYRGASHTFRLNAALKQQLEQLGQRHGATLFMTLLAVYKVLLHRYTHQNDIIVGTASHSRPQSRFKQVADYFVNPFAVRTYPHRLLSFASFLVQVRDTVIGALAHANYPFPLLVEQLQPQRSATHWPIYQTLLIVQQGPTGIDDSPAHLIFGYDGEPVNWGDWRVSANPYLNPVPVGVIGELYIGGTGLARGYQRAPGLTAGRFIPNLFAADQEEFGVEMAGVPHPAATGSRLHRTGDLGRYRPDGSIEFLGSADRQVKIRGFRIELAKIEAKLRQHPGVKEAVVSVAGNSQADSRLIAYVAADATQLLDYALSHSEGFDSDRLSSGLSSMLSAAEHDAISGLQSNRYFQQFLKTSLPDYMVPSFFVFMAALPLLPNGKLDRQGLPKIDQLLSAFGWQCVEPSNPIERTLLEIWKEVLAVDQPIGIHDSFFDVGGHSMSAIRVIGYIQNEFNLIVPMAKLFDMPTIAQLAQWIVQQQIEGQDREVLESLLDELEQIPDETGFIDDREIASARWIHE